MKSSILATLAYADIFDYPLTVDEIWTWLIWEDGRQKTKDREKFAHSLQFALNSQLIRMNQGFYFLNGREEIVVLRKKREQYSREKIKKAEKVVEILRRIPWIKLIGITGALARKNTKRNDDIDLFFITSSNRLWLSRGTIVLILSFLGLYRQPTRIKNMICPNMLVSEDNLKMGPEDLFVAHEVCLMRPIFERDQTYQRFLIANSWVEKFLPNVCESKIYNVKSKIDKRTPQILPFTFYFLDTAEQLARRLQLWYMSRRRTTEIVSDSLIKFHPKDLRLKILREFENRQKI